VKPTRKPVAESTPKPVEETETGIVAAGTTTAAPRSPESVPSEAPAGEETASPSTSLPPTPLPTHAGHFEKPTAAPTESSPTEAPETFVLTAAPSSPESAPSYAPEGAESAVPSAAPIFPSFAPEETDNFFRTAAPAAPSPEPVQVEHAFGTASPSVPEPAPAPEEAEAVVVPATPLPTHEGTHVAPTHEPEPEVTPSPTEASTAGIATAAPSVPEEGTEHGARSCSKRLDLVLLLDASMSIESELRAEIKEFAKDLITAVMDGGNSSHIGVAWFARDVGVVSELSGDSGTILSELDIWNPDVGVTTEAALALMKGKAMLETGGRPDAEKVILMIYDGKPTHVNAYKYQNYSVDAQAEAIKAAGIELAIGLVSSITGDKERAESRSRAWSHRSVVSSPWEQHLMTDTSVHALLEHFNHYLDAVCHDTHTPIKSSTWHPEGLPWQTLSCVEDVCGMLESTEDVDAAIRAVDEWRKLDYAALTSMPESMRGLEAKFECMTHVAQGVGNDHPWLIKHCNDELSEEPGFKKSWLNPSPGVSLHVTLVEEEFANVTSYAGAKLACPDGQHVIGGGCEALDSPFTVGISAHWGLHGDGASASSGWTCAYDGLKNPGFVARGGRMRVRALCSEKVVVTGTNGIRSFTTQPEPQACDRHRGRVIGGGCSTIDSEDTNWLTLAYLNKSKGGPFFGELKPINDGTMMQCAKSDVYRMTSAICVQDPLDDGVYEVVASGQSEAECRSGDYLVGGGCSAEDAPLSACLPGGSSKGGLKWKCAAKGGGAVTATAVCLRQGSEQPAGEEPGDDELFVSASFVPGSAGSDEDSPSDQKEGRKKGRKKEGRKEGKKKKGRKD